VSIYRRTDQPSQNNIIISSIDKAIFDQYPHLLQIVHENAIACLVCGSRVTNLAMYGVASNPFVVKQKSVSNFPLLVDLSSTI
jgi:hypothetical protein